MAVRRAVVTKAKNLKSSSEFLSLVYVLPVHYRCPLRLSNKLTDLRSTSHPFASKKKAPHVSLHAPSLSSVLFAQSHTSYSSGTIIPMRKHSLSSFAGTSKSVRSSARSTLSFASSAPILSSKPAPSSSTQPYSGSGFDVGFALSSSIPSYSAHQMLHTPQSAAPQSPRPPILLAVTPTILKSLSITRQCATSTPHGSTLDPSRAPLTGIERLLFGGG